MSRSIPAKKTKVTILVQRESHVTVAPSVESGQVKGANKSINSSQENQSDYFRPKSISCDCGAIC